MKMYTVFFILEEGDAGIHLVEAETPQGVVDCFEKDLAEVLKTQSYTLVSVIPGWHDQLLTEVIAR